MYRYKEKIKYIYIQHNHGMYILYVNKQTNMSEKKRRKITLIYTQTYLQTFFVPSCTLIELHVYFTVP